MGIGNGELGMGKIQGGLYSGNMPQF